MKRSLATLATLAVVALLANCSEPSAAPAPEASATPATPASPAAPAAGPRFVNRVWTVESSTAVAPGTLYVFLSEGTLVIASPNARPMLGSWKKSGDGLVMVEESISYPTDILKLDGSSFVIRSHNPGTPVDISLVPADS
ncbi:MAG: hypothetical protein ABUT39_11555 [Acidobacteriota bacterium]